MRANIDSHSFISNENKIEFKGKKNWNEMSWIRCDARVRRLEGGKKLYEGKFNIESEEIEKVKDWYNFYQCMKQKKKKSSTLMW